MAYPDDMLRANAIRQIRRRLTGALRLKRDAARLPPDVSSKRAAIIKTVTDIFDRLKSARAAVDAEGRDMRFEWFVAEARRLELWGHRLVKEALFAKQDKTSESNRRLGPRKLNPGDESKIAAAYEERVRNGEKYGALKVLARRFRVTERHVSDTLVKAGVKPRRKRIRK